MRVFPCACAGIHSLPFFGRSPAGQVSYSCPALFIMNVETQTRTHNGMLKEQEIKKLLKEIEFKTGSWQDLQADYKKNQSKELTQSGLAGMYVVWVNYSDRTVFAQAKRIYENEDRHNDFLFRIILNALSKMAVFYDLLELYEFARYGELLREHLKEIGMLKKNAVD